MNTKKILMLVAGLVIVAWLVVNLLSAVSISAIIMPGIATIFWLAMWFNVIKKFDQTIAR